MQWKSLLGRVVLIAVYAALPRFAAAVDSDRPSAADAMQKSFVWVPSTNVRKQVYAVFRKTFTLEELPQKATLRLFADSRYILWINGRYVDRGPCRFDPKGPEYDTIDATSLLKPGPNAIAVLVHHYHDGKPVQNGDSFCGRVMRHEPGLTALLEWTGADGSQHAIPTNTTWRVSVHNRFGPSDVSWSSIPDNIDARRDAGDWTAVAFDDAAWEKAVAVDGKLWGPLSQRRTPRMREMEIAPLHLVQQKLGSGSVETFPEKPLLNGRTPLTLSAGDFLVIDAGQFVQAYVKVAMNADEASQLEFQYAQTFFSTGNKPENFRVPTSRYVARKGEQTFISGDTFGFKYLLIRCKAGKVALSQINAVSRLYPFDVVGRFQSNDQRLNDIWQMGVCSVATLSEDAYVDCASRERTEWLGDGVTNEYPITRLVFAGPSDEGRPRWGDARLFGSMLRHIAQSSQPDGRVKAHHPSDRWDIHGFIDDYACLWIHGIRQYRDNTGDLSLVHEIWPAVNAQLKWFLDRRTERGLVKGREFVFPGNPLCYQTCEGTTLNAAIARALLDAASLAESLNDKERQEQYTTAGKSLSEAINKQLLDAKTGTYCGSVKDGTKTPPTVHAAGIALFFNIVPDAHRRRVEAWFLANLEKEPWEPYQFAYFQEVLARIQLDAADQKALDLIRTHWAAMAQSETRTTREGFGPSAENCHNSGASAVVYLSRHVLGVGVDGPVANHRLTIEPHLGDLNHVEGVVVTEFGPVSVRWSRLKPTGMKFDIELPKNTTARLAIPNGGKGNVLTIDGHEKTSTVDLTRRYAIVELTEGKHSGELR
jgi:hypothetical protein